MAAYKDASIADSGAYAMNTFVPALWSGRILKNLHDKQVLAGLTTREYEAEIKGKGDTVKIHSVGAIALGGDYGVSGTTVAYADLTDSEILVEVDTAKYLAFAVEDIEAVQAHPKFLSEATAEAAAAIAKHADGYIYNKMYDAAVGTGGISNSAIPEVDITTTKANLYNHLVTCGTLLDDGLAPDDGRYVVLPSFAKGALLMDDRFVSNNSAGQAGARDKGLIGMIAGFEVYTMPTSSFTRWDSYQNTAVGDLGIVTGSSADDYSCLFGRKGAIAYVEQINKVETVRLESRFADGVRILHVCGGGVIRPGWCGVFEVDDYRVTDA